VITYNFYHINTRDLLENSGGTLALNKLPPPVFSKVYSGDSVQFIQDDSDLV